MLHFIKNHFLAAKLCLLAVALLASCSSKEDLSVYIPQDAVAVGTLSTGRLAGKIALDKLGSAEWNDLLDLSERPGRPAPVPGSQEYKWKQLLKDPSQLGIAFFDDIYAYIGEMKGRELGYTGILLRLDSPEELEKYLAGDVPDFFTGATISKDDCSYRLSPDGKGAVGWNKNALLILYSPQGDVNLGALAEYSLNLKKDKSIAAKESFELFNKESKDMGVFVNVKQILSHLPSHQLPSYMLGAGVDYLAMSATFSDGQIEMIAQQHLHSSKAKEIAQLFKEVSLQEWLERFDMPQSLGYANFRYTPEWMKEFMISQMSQEQINTFLAGISLSEAEFFSLFKGNMLLACTGTGKVMREVVTYEMDAEFNMKEIKAMQEVDAPMFLAVMDTDEKEMHSLLKKLEKPAMVIEDDGSFKVTYTGYENDGWRIFLKDGKAVLTNQPNLVASPATFSSELLQEAQASPIAAYLNIEGVVEAFPLIAGMGGKEVSKHFKNIQVSASANGESVINSNIKLALQNQEQNAFLTLVKLLKGMDISMPNEQEPEKIELIEGEPKKVQ